MQDICFNKRRDCSTGMTFIEISIGLLIIGLIAGMMIPLVMRQLSKAKQTKTEAVLRGVKFAIEGFKIDTGAFPGSVMDLTNRPSDPKISPRWRGPYIENEQELQDGWGNTVMYQRSAQGQRPPYQLYSWGKDGEGSSQEGWIDAAGL